MPGAYDPVKSKMANGPAIQNAVPATAAPTKAEYDALVTRLNALLAACRDAGIISEN